VLLLFRDQYASIYILSLIEISGPTVINEVLLSPLDLESEKPTALKYFWAPSGLSFVVIFSTTHIFLFNYELEGTELVLCFKSSFLTEEEKKLKFDPLLNMATPREEVKFGG